MRYVEHWPAIRWDESAKRYYFTQYLYTLEQWELLKSKKGWIQLATFYPAIMLPIEPTNDLEAKGRG
jgi:hypothetical protein